MTELSADPRATSARPSPTTAAAPRPGPLLAVLLSAWFMAQFDFFVVNVAAPSFEKDLHAGPAALELIVGGYAFAYASGMITGGRLGDLFGHRRTFIVGLIAFAVTSLLCGIAVNPAQLVGARLLQGFAGAVMVPQVLATITATFPVHARGRAMAWYGVAGGTASVAGQVLGGLMLDADILGLGWRVLFLINVPIGVVAALLALRFLPSVRSGRRARLDLAGAGGVALTLGLVLVPLAMGRTAGWPVWTWLCLAASLPVGAATVFWQRSLAARGGAPVLDLTLFREGSYLAGVVTGAAFMAYWASVMFTLTLLLQGGFGLGPFGAGLAFAPTGVCFAASSLLSRPLVQRFGLRILQLGSVVTVAGLTALTLVLHFLPDRGALPWVVVTMAVAGVGNGLTFPQLIGASLVRVPAQRAGIGAGVLTTAQQFGGAAGVAVIGAAFFAVAGSAPTAAGYARAAMWTTVVSVALTCVVTVLTTVIRRAADRSARAELDKAAEAVRGTGG
ncbi:MFS transporter [Streptomyces monomycini]|uniref:MFS transporter n=1 Tax=Streptomyces monomycini TaxID=371720 RepID=UPI000A747C13|nr:MFS transporter [Streptomyces monomycini]